MSSLSISSSWLTHKISTFIPHTNFWHTFFVLFVLAQSLPDWVCCGGGAAGGPGHSSQLFLMAHKPKSPSDSKYSLSVWRAGVNNSRSSSLNRESSVNTAVICQCHQIQDLAVRWSGSQKRNAQCTQGGRCQTSEVVQQVTFLVYIKWLSYCYFIMQNEQIDR